jgi:serine protease Do
LLQSAFASAQVMQPAAFVSVSGSVVRIEADREQGGLSVGSGVTIAPSTVVTNCHVTRDAAAIRISGGGNLWKVTGQYADGAHDLCFLRAPSWNGRPAVLGERESLQLGQPVAAIGFTGGTGRTLRFGRVQALHTLDGGRIIESDTAFTSGASGGGLFDASGALVGLLTFRMRGSGGSYFSLPVRWIRERLPGEGQWTDIQPHPDTIPFWQRDAETLPYFMRAVPLSVEGRWTELIELAERWAAADPRDAEPLRFRGEAMRMLDRPEAAVGAYTEALALGPDVPSAWYGLALAYAVIGNAVASERAGTRLAALDRDLAAQLREALNGLADSR